MTCARHDRDPIVSNPREVISAGGGHPTHKQVVQELPGVLDVVAVVSNPFLYQSRYDLYRAFARHMQASNVRLTTVELAFGARIWEVTEPDNPRHVQLRTNSELWHKENLINLGVARLPRDWEYAAWIDADVTFQRPDWAQATLQALQHYEVVQPWSTAQDLDAKHDVMATFRSFCRCYRDYVDNPPAKSAMIPREVVYAGSGYPSPVPDPLPYAYHGYWHPGFAWAIRRDAWEQIGGLIDFAVLGAADFYMAWGLIGQLDTHLYHIEIDRDSMGGYTSAYLKSLMVWQEKAKCLLRNIGYVPGTLLHHWHGPKAKRGYNSRESILITEKYDPEQDLIRDWQGVFRLKKNRISLRDKIRAYFQARDEDATS